MKRKELPSLNGAGWITRRNHFNLTKVQLKHLKTINWLLDGPLRSGRSYVLAVAYVMKAINHPNTWITVHDHYDCRQSDYIQMDTINQLLRTFLTEKHFKIEIRRIDNSFKITQKTGRQ